MNLAEFQQSLSCSYRSRSWQIPTNCSQKGVSENPDPISIIEIYLNVKALYYSVHGYCHKIQVKGGTAHGKVQQILDKL